MGGLRRPLLGCGIALGAFSLASAAHAQTQEGGSGETRSSTDSETRASDIIVTGTLIRGVAPAGANVVTIDQARVEESGLTGTARLTEQLPQFSTSFNNFQAPSGINATLAVNRPNLRSLPGFASSGGSTTLVLMDGARIVGMGIVSTAPDMDIVPPGAIARTEIVPDGGSALYGSDAVAGVINMGTRRDYDGAEVSARYGFTDSYRTFDADATIGRKWSSGSVYLSYSYQENSTLRGYGLDFIQTQPSTNSNLPGQLVTGLNCSPGNVVAGGVGYGLPYTAGAGVPGSLNQCDPSREGVIYPSQRRHSALAGISQELSDTIRLDIRGIYMNRRTDSPGTAFRANKNIVGAASGADLVSPFYTQYQPVAGPLTTRNIVYFQYGPVDAQRQINDLEAWQVTPSITADLDANWQLRLHGSYGWSKLQLHARTVNDTALNNAITAGLFNPYDPASSNQTVVDAITNYDGYQLGIQTLQNARAVIDGDLFTLPGGSVKLAFGGEFIRETLKNRVPSGAIWRGSEDSGFAGMTVGELLGNGSNAALLPATAVVPTSSAARHVWAAFGEVVVPFFSDANAMPLFRELTLSLAARYDRYSDVGDTFNPRIGVTWRPIEWVTLRGAWGTSFNAPSLANTPAMSPKAVTNLQGSPFISFIGVPPASLVQNGTYKPYDNDQAVITISGASPDIAPQTAKTLSLGFDIDPPFVPGLRLSMTYWRLLFQNQIGIPLFPYVNFPDKVRGPGVNEAPLTEQEVADALAGVTMTGNPLTCSGADTSCVYAIIRSGIDNLGDVLARGLDFSARYHTETGFGSIDASFAGTYELGMGRSQARGGPRSINELANRGALRLTGSLGANVGNFRASVSWRHSHGYDLGTPLGAVAPFQTYAGSFNVFDTFFKINFPKDKFALTLNVNNILNQRPPFSIGAGGNGTINGQTYGRMAQIGFSKTF